MGIAEHMIDLSDQLPLMARHEGVWKGTYRYYDADGNKTDEHASTLVCRFPKSGRYPYHQTNHYHWSDGRSEVRDFPATFEGERVRWDNELIKGWAADLELDEHGRTTMLHWVRHDDPDVHLYEMIQLSDCGKYRSRVWQWFRNGRLVQRTLIDECKLTDDWAEY